MGACRMSQIAVGGVSNDPHHRSRSVNEKIGSVNEKIKSLRATPSNLVTGSALPLILVGAVSPYDQI